MTSSLERLRSLVEEGTAGPWFPDSDLSGYARRYGGPAIYGGPLKLMIAETLRAAADDDKANAALIVASHALARAMVSEEAVEKVARELAYRLGDTMGDSRAVFLSGEMHANGQRWREASRAALEALAQLANPDQDTRGEP